MGSDDVDDDDEDVGRLITDLEFRRASSTT